MLQAEKGMLSEHKLKIATIFSYQVNEDDSDARWVHRNGCDRTKKSANTAVKGLVEDYSGAYGSYISTDNSYDFYQEHTSMNARSKPKRM